MAIEEKLVIDSLKKVFAEQDLESITEKKLRRLVEKDLSYPENALDESDIKKIFKAEVLKLLERSPVAKDEKVIPEIVEPKSPVNTPIKKASKVAASKPRKKSTKISSDEKTEESEEEEESLDIESEAELPKKEKTTKVKKVVKKVETPKKRATKRALSESDGEDASPKATIQKKTPKLKKIKSEAQDEEAVLDDKKDEAEDLKDSDLSSLENSDNESKKPAAKRKSSGKRTSKTPDQPSEKTLKKINNLKSYVLKCGVRKHWKTLFANLTPRQQVNRLKEILEDLGVEGRPTIEKCKVVAKREALNKERESLDLSNIISEERRPRRACTIDYTKFVTSSKKNNAIDEASEEESEEANASEESSESEEEWDKAALSDEDGPVIRKKSHNIIQESDEESDAKIDPDAVSPISVALEKKSDSGDINDSDDNTSLPTLDSPDSKANVSEGDADGELVESTKKELELLVDIKKERSPMPAQALDDSTLKEKSSPSIANHSQGPSDEPVKTLTHRDDNEVSVSKSLPSTPPKEATPPQNDSQEQSLANQMFSDSD